MPTTATLHRHLWIAVTAIVFIPARPLHAVDGLLEINQTCAENTGCFSGDTSGFPVTIDGSAGRSYVLTGDLQVPDQNTTGIEISANDVSVDLHGFSIRGVTVCSGSPTTCSPTGSGSGISATSLDIVATEVRNGTITGMGFNGVGLAFARVERVRAVGNGAVGLATYGGGISACVAVRNGNHGIYALSATVSDSLVVFNRETGLRGGAGSVFTGNVAVNNFDIGISVGESQGGSTAVRNTASGNAGPGFAGGSHATLSQNTATYNGSIGITCGEHCTISENTIEKNSSGGIAALEGANVFDNTVGDNGDASTEDGIEVGDGSSVMRNVVRSNAHAGIRAGLGCTIADNTVIANGGSASGSGIVAGAGSSVSRNTVRENEAWGLSSTSFPVGYRDNVITFNNQAGTFGEVFGPNSVDLGGNLCSPSPCP